MAKDEYKLKFVIDADGRTAEQALKSLLGDVNKFGGSATAAFGGLIPVAGALTAGIVGIGSAMAATGATLYKFAKAASDFGSEIHDASVKTGLGAETISSLNLAASQSGTTLEQLTGGVAKFAKTVGAAGDGSEEAAKKLKSLGIDPKQAIDDLDGALGKVFKRIGDAKPGIEQITLAQKAFGKAGADLIPLMEQVGWNLDEFRKKAKELGVTIDEKAAYEADRFGDQMTLLDAQLAGVGRTIGNALLPEFIKLADETSDWLSKNQGEIKAWSNTTVDSFSAVVAMIKQTTFSLGQLGIAFEAMQKQKDGTYTAPGFWSSLLGGGALGGWFQVNKANAEYDRENQVGPFPWEMSPVTKPSASTPGSAGKATRPPKESDAQFRRFFDELGFRVVRTFGGAINDGSPHPYGGAADVSIRGKSADDVFRLIVKSLEKGYRVVDERVPVPGIRQTGPHVHVENAKTSLLKSSIIGSLGFSPDEVAYLKQLDAERLGKASGKGGFDAYRQKQTDEEKRAQDERVKLFEAAEKRKFEIGQSMTESLIALQQQEYESALKFGSSDEAYTAARNLHALKMSEIDDEIKAIEDRAARTVAGSEEEKQLVDEVTLKKIERDRLEMRSLDELDKRRQEIFDREMERDLKRLKNEQDIKKALEDETRERMMQAGMVPGYDRNGNPTAQAPGQGGGNPFANGLFGGIGVEDFQTQGDMYASTMQRIGDIGAQAFNNLAGAMGSLVDQWVLYGNTSEGAAKKAIATSLAMAASQSAVSAIMETAYGIAALTPWGAAIYGPAVLHFKSAALFAGIALGTGLLGRAVAGNSFSQQGSGGGGTGSGSGSVNSPAPNTPYSRASATAYYSGRDNPTDRLAAEVRSLHQKIASMSPGDVLTAGTKQRRGHIADTVVSEMASDASKTRNFLTTAGFNTR